MSHRHRSCPILSLHHFLHHLEVFFKIACNNVRFKSTFVERQYKKAFSLYRAMSNYLISADLNITSRQEKVVTIILRIFMRMHLKHADSKAHELWCRVLNLMFWTDLWKRLIVCVYSAEVLWHPLLERMCNELNGVKVLFDHASTSNTKHIPSLLWWDI